MSGSSVVAEVVVVVEEEVLVVVVLVVVEEVPMPTNQTHQQPIRNKDVVRGLSDLGGDPHFSQ